MSHRRVALDISKLHRCGSGPIGSTAAVLGRDRAHTAMSDNPGAGARMRGMPGTNLTREEATARAALIDVTSYTVELDLTQAETDGVQTFGTTSTIAFTCREPGAETWVDLVDATVHEITLNGTPIDPSAYVDSRIPLPGLQAENTVVVRADCTYSHTGEGLHHFVDPADGRVYLYSQ